MGTKPIRPLLIKACLPLMLSLLVNNLYHFVDSMYVSRLGEAELSAMSLAAPVMTLLAALGSGIAVGLNAVVSKALGEKNEKDVQRAIRTAIFMAAAAYGVIVLGGILLIRPYFLTQTDTPEIVESGVAYLGTYMVLACGLMVQMIPNGIALGVIPIVAYNYGAKKQQRIVETIKYSLRYALAGSLAGMAVLMVIPGVAIGLFNPTDMMAGMAIPAIRTMSVALPLASVSIIMASVFQGFGRARYSMYLSLARQIIVLLPAAAALYRMLKQNVMNQI